MGVGAAESVSPVQLLGLSHTFVCSTGTDHQGQAVNWEPSEGNAGG